MWTKKHRDLRTQQSKKIKQTVAELAAVRIIETWFLKKRRTATIKPETKRVANNEIDLMKSANKELAKTRLGIK